MNNQISSFAAASALFAAGYKQPEIKVLLAEADRFPELWAYAPDRRRCVVKHMPSGGFEVRDCAESEARIAAARQGRSR
jgi:hypothetical protein